ncbi:MAG: YqgE/AlgH family protein [Actinobacteria bacterium]|nr:YqgE/AlgH family protein [Actinomycetota bacterium]
MADSLIGGLLVAGPRLIDPNFFRTVVLLCGHDDDGALGLVLNRPTDLAVGDYLPGWVERLTRPEVVFAGGPVQPDTAIGLGRRSSAAPAGWSQVAGDLGLVDLTMAPAAVVGDISALRVFAGYAGWGPGQLEAEILTGDWVLAGGDPGDGFGSDPDGLWRTVLLRKGGAAALYANFPIDPHAN